MAMLVYGQMINITSGQWKAIGSLLAAVSVALTQAFPNSVWTNILSGLAGLVAGGALIRRPGDAASSSPSPAQTNLPPPTGSDKH